MFASFFHYYCKIGENGQSSMMDSEVHMGSDRRFLLLATRVSLLHAQRLGIWVERCYHALSIWRDVSADERRVLGRPGTLRSGSLSTGSSIGRLFQPAEKLARCLGVPPGDHPDVCSSRSQVHVSLPTQWCHVRAATAVRSCDT